MLSRMALGRSVAFKEKQESTKKWRRKQEVNWKEEVTSEGRMFGWRRELEIEVAADQVDVWQVI